MQTSDGGFVLANKEYTDNFYRWIGGENDTGIVKIKKVDRNFNTLWTYRTDTLPFICGADMNDLKNEMALFESNNSIHISYFSRNVDCPGYSCNSCRPCIDDFGTRSISKLNTIELNQQGQYIKNDSFVLSHKYFDSISNLNNVLFYLPIADYCSNSEWYVKNVVKTPNGFRYVLLNNNIFGSLCILDYNITTKKQTVLYTKKLWHDVGYADVNFKKGFANDVGCKALDTLTNHNGGCEQLYEFNSDYSYAFLNRNTSYLFPYPFKTYYNGQFQWIRRMEIYWYDENIDGSIIAQAKVYLMDTGYFRAIISIQDITTSIKGSVYTDNNSNCQQDANEKKLPSMTVTATSPLYTTYTGTDPNGNYEFLLDTGHIQVSVRPNINYPYFMNGSCSSPQNFYAPVADTLFDNVNFGLTPTINCILNTVNLSTTPPFRIGRPKTYNVSYCNNGTIASPNTYIIIKLDSLLDLDSASISYTSLPNHTYRFNIGNLDFLNCGNFSFVATPRIGAVILSQTLCAEAHIYPDTICGTPNYTGAFIEASAQCLGDSVRFQLQNTGVGNMPAIKKYIVIEDNVLRINRNYQLNANQILTETIDADSGRTYRIIADQPDELPASYGDKFATAAIENCQPVQGNFHTGYFTQFPNYDGEPYRAMSCNVITGSYDPNEKVASPVGYAAQHYIEANTQIDYQINFQNTGNDTAFKVVVADTISPTLDINSIQLGVGSHAYQFQRTDSNVVQFVLDSINLVDSFRNERLSHGFVKFKIQQKANNPDGTKIYNKAAIYFDYNTPITTNKTMHTIGRDFVQVNLISGIKNTQYHVKAVKVYPNPFREKTQIIIESDALKNPVLILQTLEGQIIKSIPSSSQNTFDVYREDLTNGMYIFKVVQNNEQIASGKLVIQ